jgi:hypothetical protein
MIVLLGTNIDSFDVSALKMVAHQACSIDLSSAKKDLCEPVIALTRMKERRINTGSEVLQYSQRVQKHFFFTFAIGVPCSNTFELLEVLNSLNTTGWECGRNSDLVIASGTLDQWVHVITVFSEHETDQVLLKILNLIQDKIESYGL